MDNSLTKRLFRKIVFSILVIGSVLSFLIPCSLSAQNGQVRTLKVGFYELDGYHNLSREGVRSGYGYDFLTLMRRYSNVKFEYVGYDRTWPDMKAMLLNGEIDFVTSGQKSEDMLSQFDFSGAIGSASIQLNVPFDNASIVSGNYRTYNGITIGLIRGGRSISFLDQFASENGFTYKKKFYDTSEDLAKALRTGEIDAIASTSLRKTYGEKTISEFGNFDFYAIVRKGDTETLDIINKAITQINSMEGNWQSDLYYRNYIESNFSGITFTQEERQYIQEHSRGDKKIIVGFDNVWPPFVWKVGHTYNGIIPDYWDLIMKMTGMNYEFYDASEDMMPESEILSGKMDIYLGFGAGADKNERKGFVESPYFLDAGSCYITSKKNLGKPVKKIGVSEVNPHLNSMLTLEEGQTVVGYQNSRALLKALQKGQVDEAFLYYIEGEYVHNMDRSGSLVFRLIPEVGLKLCAISPDDKDHTLISIVSKCIKLVSESELNTLVTDNLTYAANDFTLGDFIVLHPFLTILFIIFLFCMFFGAHYYALKHRNEKIYNAELLSLNKALSEKKEELEKERQYLQTHFDYAEAISRDISDCFVVDVKAKTSTPIKIAGTIFTPERRQARVYEDTWKWYIDKYVCEEDRKEMAESVDLENVIYRLSFTNEFFIRYRILNKGEEQYYQLNFARIHGSVETFMMGFRCVDSIVRAEQEQNALLRKANETAKVRLSEIVKLNESLNETAEIISNAGYGVWRIVLNKEKPNEMSANATLQRILGIEDMYLNPEQLYVFYHDRLMEDVRAIENDDYASMENGEVRSKMLTWQHPTKGIIFLMAGGTRYRTSSGEDIISGYCADITDQKSQKDRSDLIISALAHSFSYMNYIDLEDKTYLTTTAHGVLVDEDKVSMTEGDITSIIDYFCSKRVSSQFREEMIEFMDLSTINERMAHRHMILNQFKTDSNVWYEASFIVANRTKDGLVKQVLWTIRKIEDEKQAEIRKQRMIDDNIAANKAKTKFLQNMSHEIRTPLNAMFGFSQLLGMPDGSWTEEEKSQYNSYVYNSYNMLDMLIGDIIDISDSEHGNYRINISTVEVNAVCNSALMSAEFRRPADVKMYFTSDLDDSYTIQSDGRRIQQVLINYLTNACKHTTKGEIHLHCSTSETPGKLTLSVTDTGTGVPADKADIIFDRFTKLDQFVQGSGLGLNICQTIADKLGGKVYLDKTYTTGARFVFVIDDK